MNTALEMLWNEVLMSKLKYFSGFFGGTEDYYESISQDNGSQVLDLNLAPSK
jgi:hypothetical protein